MTPIDLLDFAEAKKKIPSSVIQHIPGPSEQLRKRKILLAHAIDLITISWASLFLVKFFEASFQSFMVTRELRQTFGQIPFESLMITIMPLMFTSYFFFSFFFNQGQSWGMKKMKMRVTIPIFSYRSSLVWAMFSASAMMTAGLTLLSYAWIQKKGWGEFKTEDYLYEGLVQYKDFTAFNLVEAAVISQNISTLIPATQDNDESIYEAA